MTDTRQTETTSLWNGDGPSRAPIGLLAPGTRLGERYDVRSVLGHGGFAVVYLAYDRELGRDVALKVLREDRLSPGSLSRLKREVRVARDLAHTNLVRVFDIESAGSAVFVTLEAVTSGSLRDRLSRGPLGIEEALRIATGIFRGLGALHGAGVVHRDVKPGNVLLTTTGEVKLADFGLALHLEGGDTRVTATEAAVGTLEYLAPEQAMGEEVDPRTDLYSAGVVLFEMLAGRLPHSGRSSLGNLIARFRERPADISLLRPEVPRWLARLLARLLARERGERYPSAAAVLHDLERRRAAMQPSRRRRIALAAALLAGVGLALAAGAWLRAGSHQFSHVSVEGGSTCLGVDRQGRTLWRYDDVPLASNFVPFRPTPGGPVLLAATLNSATSPTLAGAQRLDFLDPQSGRSVDHMTLPDGGQGYFANFSRTYGSRIHVLDVDGDGSDELIASFSHIPYWPSFSILVEPGARRAQTILVASGHHFFLGSADLDGDGRLELLFGGVNNRMGWRVGLAAVRVPPMEVRARAQTATAAPALSADRFAWANLGDSLAWYAVGPRALLRDDGAPFSVSATDRRLTLHFFDHSRADFDFDGFPFGSGRGLERGDRQARRNAAYLNAAEAARLLDGDHPGAALALLDQAAMAARATRDPHLAGWLAQVRIEALVAARRDADADHALAEAIEIEPSAASEAALTAARSWHRVGALERALAAYARSESLPGFAKARPAWETLEGRVLALVEFGRFDEALSVTRAYARTFGTDDRLVDAYSQFAIWRSGGRPDPARLEVGPGSLDLHRYWDLEARALRDEDPGLLLGAVRSERAQSTGTAPLLESLESELLFRLGRREEARAVARAALKDLDAGITREIPWRVHRPILVERLQRFSGQAGA